MPEHKKDSDVGALVVAIIQLTGEVLLLIAQTLYFIILEVVQFCIGKQPKSVKGEIVLVTGGGHGIGRELSLLYASEGATVVVWDINETTGRKTVDEINSSGYPKVAYSFVCNVSDHDEVLRVAKEVQEKVGDVTILVNNAGIMPTHSLLEHTKDEIDRIIGINVLAHFWTLKAFLPSMKKNNYGHIVSLSSSAGLIGIKNIVPYCASKFAVRGLTEGLWEELRSDKKNEIKITSIHPYMVDTGLCKKPIIKFQNIFSIVDPKDAARQIVDAQRKDLREITIPGYILMGINNLRLLPTRARDHIMDFMGIGLESDL